MGMSFDARAEDQNTHNPRFTVSPFLRDSGKFTVRPGTRCTNTMFELLPHLRRFGSPEAVLA